MSSAFKFLRRRPVMLAVVGAAAVATGLIIWAHRQMSAESSYSSSSSSSSSSSFSSSPSSSPPLTCHDQPSNPNETLRSDEDLPDQQRAAPQSEPITKPDNDATDPSLTAKSHSTDDLDDHTDSHSATDRDDDGQTETEDETESISDTTTEPDELAQFENVIHSINFEALIRIAVETRLKLRPTSSSSDGEDPISCRISESPLFGSFNIVYVLTFSDGMKWVARLPGHGASFKDLDVQKMDSEYHTMRYIRAHTSVPLPEVFLWDIGMEKIGAAFALMSFVEGRPLSEVWCETSSITEEKRQLTLSDIAFHMSQLRRLQFNEMGTLRFHEDGSVAHVGPNIYLQATGEMNWGRAFSAGPFESLQDHFIDGWDDLEGCSERAKADMPILRTAVDSIPDFMVSKGRFSLSPVDLSLQNIFVDQEGRVTGFIDWDGVGTRPPSLGCTRYPSWITRDWDPAMYMYGCDAEDGADFYQESSPEQLSIYRQHYSRAFEALHLPDYDFRHTRLSHIMEAIDLALQDRGVRGDIVHKLLDHAFDGQPPFTLKDYTDAFLEGDTEEFDELIEHAFGNMWHTEWESGEVSAGVGGIFDKSPTEGRGALAPKKC